MSFRSLVEHYAIRGGVQGRERLQLLARVMHPGTAALFERRGIGGPLSCLDAGCGGGDVSLELARRVASGGRVLGVDMDATKLQLARAEAAAQGIANVEFRAADVQTLATGTVFDVVYARFLLSHLADPAAALKVFQRQLKPAGQVIIEDVDFSGCFTWPASRATRRYEQLYCAVVRARGGDPDIGPRLPSLLADAGFDDIGMHVVQPSAMQGEAKLATPLTLQNIAAAIVHDGLATQEEIDQLEQELFAFAQDPCTVAGLPRVIQAWGRRRGT